MSLTASEFETNNAEEHQQHAERDQAVVELLSPYLVERLETSRVRRETSFGAKVMRSLGMDTSHEIVMRCVILGQGVVLPKSLKEYHVTAIDLPIEVDGSSEQERILDLTLRYTHFTNPTYRLNGLSCMEASLKDSLERPYYTFECHYTSGSPVTASSPSPLSDGLLGY